MTSQPLAFVVGSLYSSDDIQTWLAIGNAGGVRVCLDDESNVRRMAILTSVPDARQSSENPYHDRTEGDILVYTGAGREGDQLLAGINKRIPQQLEQHFPIYGFQIIGSRRDRSIGKNRWKFIGLLEYIRHYPEYQVDVRNEMRQVWLFEFFVHTEPSAILVSDDKKIAQELLIASSLQRQSTPDDRAIVSPDAEGNIESDRRNAVEIETERVRLLQLSPQEFEHEIQATLTATGFERVQVTKYSQDGGIDVNAYTSLRMWPIRNLLIQIQAKRWLHTVGRKEVAELRGSLQPFARGAVVTTSHFSRAAIAEAQEAGKNPIVLIDGHSFAKTVQSLRQTSSS
jgi:HJR/Mrr/RecB family endonuclease